ncbi:hypothetical protein ACKLNR_008231 [Fusarium oxysporum f. sp. zingiberi]
MIYHLRASRSHGAHGPGKFDRICRSLIHDLLPTPNIYKTEHRKYQTSKFLTSHFTTIMDSSMGPFSTNGNDSSAKYIVDKAGSHDEAVIIGSVFFVAIVGVACMFFKERSRKIKDQQAATKTVSASEYV